MFTFIFWIKLLNFDQCKRGYPNLFIYFKKRNLFQCLQTIETYFKIPFTNGWVSVDKSNKHTLIYIYGYMFQQFLIIFQHLLTDDICVTLFPWLLVTVLNSHLNHQKHIFRWFLVLFSTISLVKNSQISCIDHPHSPWPQSASACLSRASIL